MSKHLFTQTFRAWVLAGPLDLVLDDRETRVRIPRLFGIKPECGPLVPRRVEVTLRELPGEEEKP